ncbi:MAG: response regulator [Desulfobacteraceae bacterium]
MSKQPKDKPTVLIVDDVAENLRILIELLKDDYHVIPLKSGNAALKKLAQDPLPDLALLDIVMPEMDGYELCTRLKADPRTKDIPVIFITAVSEAMDDAKAFALGAVDYVPKPFNPLTVKARVNTHIKLHRTLKELQNALKDIRTLSGLIPICSSCKKIRDDKGFWNQVEIYIEDRSDAQFSHGICPDCRDKIYPEYSKK